ncbi:MAG: hypothetical protein FWC72_05985 [Oscillospiraceae bacterium]|nr:hypothetical protein [Oscillospiraceae bacterium]
MNHVHFVMHLTRKTLLFKVLFWIILSGSLMGALLLPALLIPHVLFGYGDLIIILGFYLLCVTGSLAFGLPWKLAVTGDELHKRGLFSRSALTFQGLGKAELANNRKKLRLYPLDVTINRIVLSTKATGYALLVTRLQEANVPGAENLCSAGFTHYPAQKENRALMPILFAIAGGIVLAVIGFMGGIIAAGFFG